MIICIPYVSNKKGKYSGKWHFCKRLAKALRKIGIDVIYNIGKRHDIVMHIIVAREKSTCKAKQVLRLDGIWHNKYDGSWNKNKPIDFKKRNKEIAKSYFSSDAIVYQSGFCKKVIKRYIGTFSGLSSVIFNGSDIDYYHNITPAKTENANCFFAYASWRPHKRLKDIIESFLLADIDDSCLYVAGNTGRSGLSSQKLKKYFSSDKINYLGVLDQDQIISYLKTCRASIHLSWIDWCPNSVVEAIAIGVPVITNNVGGTQELVSPGAGIVCDIDKHWNYNPCSLYKPPRIDREIVATAIRKLSNETIQVKKDHIDINNIAQQYKLLFEKVLG